MPREIFAICTKPGSIRISVFVDDDKILILRIAMLRHSIGEELHVLGETHGIRTIYDYENNATDSDDLVWPLLPRNNASSPIRFDPVPVEVPQYIHELTGRLSSVENTVNSAVQSMARFRSTSSTCKDFGSDSDGSMH